MFYCCVDEFLWVVGFIFNEFQFFIDVLDELVVFLFCFFLCGFKFVCFGGFCIFVVGVIFGGFVVEVVNFFLCLFGEVFDIISGLISFLLWLVGFWLGVWFLVCWVFLCLVGVFWVGVFGYCCFFIYWGEWLFLQGVVIMLLFFWMG